MRAFSMYMGSQSRSDFERPMEDLRGSSHPVTWLRLKLLLSQARTRGLHAEAEQTEEEWESIAGIIGVTEDYHGFYDETLNPAIYQMLEDAIVEVAPREYLNSEIEESIAVPTALESPVTLLNRAWVAFSSDDIEYQAWESEAIETWLSE